MRVGPIINTRINSSEDCSYLQKCPQFHIHQRRNTMSKLIVTILLFVLINGHTNDVEAEHHNSSQVQNTTAKPLPFTTPKPMILPQNQTQLNSTRKARIFSGLSFLTGLGLGSIAGAAALNDPSFLSKGNYNIISRLPTTTKVPPTDMNLSFGSSEYSPLVSIQEPGIYNPSYPYVLALSTNALVNQTLRSVHQTLNELKEWLIQKETVSEQQPLDDVNEVDDEESNDVSVYKVKDNYVVVNYTTLKDIVKASIAEEIAKRPLIRATPVESSDLSVEIPSLAAQIADTANRTNTTTTDTTTTTPSPTRPSFDGYYYGQPQNISGVDVTSGGYGFPAQQLYPIYAPYPEIHPVSPPIYGPTSFQHENHPDSYYDSYPGPSTSGFTSAGSFYPHYEPYARGRKFPSRESKDLSDFVPSKIIG